jgi:hypothetical protein
MWVPTLDAPHAHSHAEVWPASVYVCGHVGWLNVA